MGKYYAKYFLDGTCPKCSGFALLIQRIHENENHEFGMMVVDIQSFKYVTYEQDYEKERKI
jgi:hypothetical protein